MYAKTTRVRATRDWLFFTSILYFLLGAFPTATAASDLLTTAFAVGAIALMIAGVAWHRSWRCQLRADAEGLWDGAKLIAPIRSIRFAHVRTRHGTQWLRLEKRIGRIEVELTDESDERPLLEALRLDPRGVVARFSAEADRAGSRAEWIRRIFMFGVPGLAAAALIALVPFSHFWTIESVVFAGIAIQLAATFRHWERIGIGADGLRLRRVLGRTRFVPFDSIASIQREKRDVIVTLADGREIAWHGSRFERWNEMLGALENRIERGLRAHRALVANEAAAHLARGSRPLATWLRDLELASDPERSTYRVAPLSEDELWKTLENASAPPTARAGAAVALRRVLDDVRRKRVREVAATCASPALRLALETCAGDGPIEERLAALRDG